MKTKLAKTILTLVIGLLGFCLIDLPVSVYAEDICSSGANDEVKAAAGCFGNDNALPDVIVGILNSVIAISGLIAVIFIIIGGINYMTSSGDGAKLEKAKKTILYAAIGIIICAVAFALVNFVIGIL